MTRNTDSTQADDSQSNDDLFGTAGVDTQANTADRAHGANSTSADSNGADDNADSADADAKPNKSRGLKLFIRDVLIILLAAIIISFLIKTFLIRSFYIPSDSMMDTLLENDRIIVNQLEPDLMPIQHGDVVVFEDGNNWLPATVPVEQNPIQAGIDTMLSIVGLSAPDSNDHLIKRVIGLPGDRVICCDDFGQLSVNGVPLEEPYTLIPEGETDADPYTFDVTVPEGKLWVMGDNRYNSADSAYHFHANDPSGGFVPISDVVGRALLISWPLDRWSWLDNYPTVFDGVEDKARENQE